MLTKIVDTSQVKIENIIQQSGLAIDLNRLKKLKHNSKPTGTEAFKIVVRNGTFFDSFLFEIQYGRIDNGQFKKIGESATYCTDTLPYLI
ncbi:MAG: hypothetical protein WC438_03330 [Candidatus Pacearchaeota archaeon]